MYMFKKQISVPLYIWIIVFMLFGGGLWYINKQVNKLNTIERNLNASQTELVQVKRDNGDLISVNNMYKVKIGDLEKSIDISKQEVKDLQRDLNASFSYISKLESQIKLPDTVYIENEIEKIDSSYIYKFNWKNEWMNLSGATKVFSNNSITEIYDLNIDVPLIVGLTDDYKIFATTNNPYLHITSIEGAELDQNIFKKKWDIKWSMQLGFGLNYGIINKSLDIGPYAGWGFTVTF